MFKALILVVAVVFSSVSYGRVGIPLVLKYARKGHIRNAAALANARGITFPEIVSAVKEEFRPRSRVLSRLGREMGLSSDEIESTGVSFHMGVSSDELKATDAGVYRALVDVLTANDEFWEMVDIDELREVDQILSQILPKGKYIDDLF